MKNINLLFQNSDIRPLYNNGVTVMLNGTELIVKHGMANVTFKVTEWDADDFDGLSCILENYENGSGSWVDIKGYDQSPLQNLVSDYQREDFYKSDATFEDMLNHIKQYGFKSSYIGSLESFKEGKNNDTTIVVNELILTLGMIESLIKETLKRLEVRTNKDIVNRIVSDIKANGLSENTILKAI